MQCVCNKWKKTTDFLIFTTVCLKMCQWECALLWNCSDQYYGPSLREPMQAQHQCMGLPSPPPPQKELPKHTILKVFYLSDPSALYWRVLPMRGQNQRRSRGSCGPEMSLSPIDSTAFLILLGSAICHYWPNRCVCGGAITLSKYRVCCLTSMCRHCIKVQTNQSAPYWQK